MWHVYAYVPAVANVLVTDTFALLPPMSVGAPACCVKNTLCATEPKANVTTSPTYTVSVAGVNARDGVAATVLPGAGAGAGAGVGAAAARRCRSRCYRRPPSKLRRAWRGRVESCASTYASPFGCEGINLGRAHHTVLIETSANI